MLAWLEAGCRLAGVLGDDVALYALAGRLEGQARRQGAVTALGTALIYSGQSEMFAGSLDEAEARFTERGAIEAVRDYDCRLGEVILKAWRGHDREARAGALAVAAAARAHGDGWKLAWVEYSLCVLELSNGRYQEAVTSTPTAFGEDLLLSAFALADFIEAAVRCGNAAAARQGLARIADWAPAGGSPMALGLLARSRALVADDQEAEAFYAEALDCLARCRGAVHLARTQLLYGEWLRRRKRRAEAREHLRAAYAHFEDMGAAGFAERARLELVATGETARKRSPETRYDLTPQEAQIATLAAAGATNPEIASKLFISPSTVDYHLRKVFRKLDVTSRRHLARMPLGNT